MPETDVAAATVTDLQNIQKSFVVGVEITDGTSGHNETTWEDEDFEKNLGYYKKIPEFKASVDAKARWTIGKGFQTDAQTTIELDKIRGWGKDTFNSIMEDSQRVKQFAGNYYAEIILDKKDNFINLKPLNPGSMRHVVNPQGMLIRFEQIDRTTKNVMKKFKPEEIFYLAHNRIADEIHGTSDCEALKPIIDARNEALADSRVLHHRNVPVRILYVASDDENKLAALKNQELILLPKGTVETDVHSVAGNSIINPLAWIESLNRYFYQASGGTDILVGATQGITDAGEKVKMVALEATILEAQLELKEQLLAQLNLVGSFVLPVTLQQDAASDQLQENLGTGDDVGVNPVDEEPVRDDVGVEDPDGS